MQADVQPPPKPHLKDPRARQVVVEVLGITNLEAFHIAEMLFHIGNLMERANELALKDSPLSSARLRLLMPLLIAERLGESVNISPTMLSRLNNVSRNTISALLRSLEEQGLITRELDADDRRKFLIRLTDAGRARVLEQAPQFGAFTQGLFANLTAAERETLLRLLNKVRDTLIAHCAAHDACFR